MRRALTILLLAVTLAACGRERRSAPAGPPKPPPEAIVKVSENGPVKATVKVWPPAPQLGDPLYLELTVEAAPGVTVAAPFEDEGLGRFAAIGWLRDVQRRGDGGSVEIQTYTLEAPGSGKHRIPPLRLVVTDARTDAKAAPTELLTEEVPIAVAPVDPARAAEPLAAARGTLPIVVGGWAWWQIALAIGAGVVVLVGVGFGVRAARHRATARARVSAYEAAVARLVRLEQSGPPDGERLDPWFVELSAIVRQYLEGRYGLRAPELTTEEFLTLARSAPGLSPEHRAQLTAFLERCDQVKFAGYRPDADESIATLAAARAFIEDTRPREEAA